MKGLAQEKICPQCGASKMKNWQDLSADQKLFVESLPLNTDYTPGQRKKHRFCERCFFEQIPNINEIC